jgi:hypothetical protein
MVVGVEKGLLSVKDLETPHRAVHGDKVAGTDGNEKTKYDSAGQ